MLQLHLFAPFVMFCSLSALGALSARGSLSALHVFSAALFVSFVLFAFAFFGLIEKTRINVRTMCNTNSVNMVTMVTDNMIIRYCFSNAIRPLNFIHLSCNEPILSSFTKMNWVYIIY